MVDIGKRQRIRLSVVACPFFSRLLLLLLRPLPGLQSLRRDLNSCTILFTGRRIPISKTASYIFSCGSKQCQEISSRRCPALDSRQPHLLSHGTRQSFPTLYNAPRRLPCKHCPEPPMA